MCLDWLCTRQENDQDSSPAGKRRAAEFERWLTTLGMPPQVSFRDREQMAGAIHGAVQKAWTAAMGNWTTQRSARATTGEEGVPEGWSNEELVAQMKATAGLT